MTDHLSDAILNALADGELPADQLADANRHLAGCPSCTSSALHQTLLKSATAKAGLRYSPPPDLQERLLRLTSRANSQSQELSAAPVAPSRSMWGFGPLGWSVAAVLLVSFSGTIFMQRAMQSAKIASAENAALVTEVFDQHVAALAGNRPLQVVSTDRHTVKPWFQGKIPFSFNLPQSLPGDTTLDGANLTYVHSQPVAQLLYSIGKHRVSVFLRQRSRQATVNESLTERSGFHVMSAGTSDLELVAVSDVEQARLAELVNAIKHVQTGDQTQPQ